MENSAIDILELYHKNERKIEDLYRLCATKFPASERMWTRLADEEKKHALILELLIKEINGQDEIFEINEYSMGAINYVSDFIDKQYEKIASEGRGLTEALESALSIERSMIEKKCFEMFLPKNPEIKNVLNGLNRETDQHIKALEKMLVKSGK